MTYSKPELLATEAALAAICGAPKSIGSLDSDIPPDVSPGAAYEVDE